VVGYAMSPHVVVPHVAVVPHVPVAQSGTSVSDLVNVLRLLHETGGMQTATNSQSGGSSQNGGSDLHDRVSDLTSRITALEKDLEALKGQSGQAGADVQSVLKSLQADIASIKSKLGAP
jgi:outer membrane murein-binding lipoprotein Lpp